MLSNRAFFIDYRVPFPLEDIIAPNAVDWRVSKDGTAARHGRMPNVKQWKIYKLMNVDRVREKQCVTAAVLASAPGRKGAAVCGVDADACVIRLARAVGVRSSRCLLCHPQRVAGMSCTAC